jgi:hypothetical protein
MERIGQQQFDLYSEDGGGSAEFCYSQLWSMGNVATDRSVGNLSGCAISRRAEQNSASNAGARLMLGRCFSQQLSNKGTQLQIFHSSKVVDAQGTGPIDQHKARCAT